MPLPPPSPGAGAETFEVADLERRLVELEQLVGAGAIRTERRRQRTRQTAALLLRVGLLVVLIGGVYYFARLLLAYYNEPGEPTPPGGIAIVRPFDPAHQWTGTSSLSFNDDGALEYTFSDDFNSPVVYLILSDGERTSSDALPSTVTLLHQSDLDRYQVWRVDVATVRANTRDVVEVACPSSPGVPGAPERKEPNGLTIRMPYVYRHQHEENWAWLIASATHPEHGQRSPRSPAADRPCDLHPWLLDPV